MDAYSLRYLLCIIAAAALVFCALMMLFTAYREKKTCDKRWNKISDAMELVEPGITYRLECDEVLIGRHTSADVRISDASVSRYHAVLTLANGIWTINDIGSKTGVYVNGNKVEQCRLHDNDVIKLGSHRLTIRKRRKNDA